jgi:hypothetical protein
VAGPTSVGPPRKLGPAFCYGGGTGLAREPSLQWTDGAPPFGGDPGRNFGSAQPETSVEGSPIGRDGLAGSRKDTGATLPSFHAIPEGVRLRPKSSRGFAFAERQAPCAYRKPSSLGLPAFRTGNLVARCRGPYVFSCSVVVRNDDSTLGLPGALSVGGGR